MKKLILPLFVFATFCASAAGYFGVKPVVNSPSCYGGNSGSISLSVVGGTAPYTYSWSSGLPPVNTVNNLPGGTYSVTVTDANGQTTSYTLTVAEPFEMQPEIEDGLGSFQQNTGSLMASCDGGTPGYTYSWSNGATTSTIGNLGVGTFTCTITDAAGCTVTDTKHTSPNPHHYNGPVSDPTNGNDPRSLGATGNNDPDNGAQATTGNRLSGQATATLTSADVEVYPNPARNLVYVSTGEVENSQINILDMNGQQVYTQKTQTSKTGISVSGLQVGSYIIQVEGQNGTTVNKTVNIIH